MQDGEDEREDPCPLLVLQKAGAGDESRKRNDQEDDRDPGSNGPGDKEHLPVAGKCAGGAEGDEDEDGNEVEEGAVDNEEPAERPDVLLHTKNYLPAVFAFDVTTGRPASFQPFQPPRSAAVFLMP